MEEKRLTNNNLDEYDPEYDFCIGCEHFGEPNGCNRSNGTCASYERFMETYNRLAELEDKIEQGTLIELPCKVGDTVYYVLDYGSVKGECVSLEIGKVSAVSIQRNHIWIEANYEDGLRMQHRKDEIGKTVFLTREEAEKRLKEIQE